jgi:hypothetical protein
MRTSVLCAGLWVFSVASFGQGLGEFVGTVTDPTGGAIASAKVTVTEAGTGFARTTVASAEGFYTSHPCGRRNTTFPWKRRDFEPTLSRGSYSAPIRRLLLT